MPELRQDPLDRRWVVVAPQRLRRPPPAPRLEEPPFCPFCPGHEDATPPELLRLPAEGDWSVRVFPNRLPALRVEEPWTFSAAGLYDRASGVGAHEVVVETPQHGVQLAELDYRSVERVLRAWRTRQRDLFRDGRLEYVAIFRNQGFLAGAPLAHSHSQLLATPVIPPRVLRRIENSLAYFRRHRRCLLCDVAEQELAAAERVVWADSRFLLLAPYASRVPFELQLLPRRHDLGILDLTDEEISALARVLRDALRRIARGLGEPAVQLALLTAPNPNPLRPTPPEWELLPWAYHWCVEILPRLAPEGALPGSVELPVNPVPPEEAAAFLRGISP